MNLSSTPFSLHNDVLSATPSTTPEKLSLLEELKRRGRVSVSTKRYPDAKDLYTKAIDTLVSVPEEEYAASKKDLAVLHSNRSLCNLQMNITADSYDDAVTATVYDPTYLKSFWRLGQACMAKKNTEEALIAYESALALDSENKALKKECVKVKKQLEKEEKEKKEEAERKEKMEEEEKKNPTPPPLPPVKKVQPKATTASSSSPSKEKAGEKGTSKSSDFSKSDHVRGYKIVNGKKTSFFHHEMTEEEKRLIGDITPKRLDPSQIPSSTSTTATSSSSSADQSNPSTVGKTSAWNKAQTWEEKDVTDWAIQSLQDKISQCSYVLPAGSPDPDATARVTKVTKLISSKKAGGTAHASVASVRGKKKYIFEFNVGIHWEMKLGNGRTCKGEMTFLDVDGTHVIGEGFDVHDYIVDSDTPSDARFLLEKFVKNGGLRSAVETGIDEWIGLFRETYS